MDKVETGRLNGFTLSAEPTSVERGNTVTVTMTNESDGEEYGLAAEFTVSE